MRTRFVTTERKQLDYYKGMLIHADLGVHYQAMELFDEYMTRPGPVLDVGAGAGAFSLRLADAGYDVTALDIDREKWNLADIPFITLDINSGIAGTIADGFKSVCCLEVVEHVENPWKLLRDLYAVTEPGGRLLLSTPNIASFLSRLIFLRTGKFHQFNDADLAYGHISPITAWELSVVSRQAGWRTLEIRPGGYLPILDLSEVSPRALLQNFLRLVSYCVAQGEKNGWCLFFVLEKPG